MGTGGPGRCCAAQGDVFPSAALHKDPASHRTGQAPDPSPPHRAQVPRSPNQGKTSHSIRPSPRRAPVWGPREPRPDVALQEQAAVPQVGRAAQAAGHLPVLLHDLDHLAHGWGQSRGAASGGQGHVRRWAETHGAGGQAVAGSGLPFATELPDRTAPRTPWNGHTRGCSPPGPPAPSSPGSSAP